MGRFFFMLRSDTRAMGRVLDVLHYNKNLLRVTKAKGSARIPRSLRDRRPAFLSPGAEVRTLRWIGWILDVLMVIVVGI